VKFKLLLGILALCIAFFYAIRIAVGWFPEEDAMQRALQHSSMSSTSAIAANFETESPQNSAADPTTETTSPSFTNIQHSSPAPCVSTNTVAANSTAIPVQANAAMFSVSQYQPRVEVRLADPTNYGERSNTDVYGQPVSNDFIAVLHETVYSASSAINYFQTPHPKDEDQASYHTLIRRDGAVVYIVPPEKRAYGAGNSVFSGSNGTESVKTKRDLAPSVNNFAYHISLETPVDGRGEGRSHSGYTNQQYQSLAWLLAQTSIPEERITTHRAVDRSGSRFDPRSFDRNQLLGLLKAYPRSVRSSKLERCDQPTLAQQPSPQMDLN
jgi:N-acetyl-anhydromuramyl-L-alanine amidase AmpD